MAEQTQPPLGDAQTEERLAETVATQPHPLVFVTVSGAHLYGFPSPDSDYDLRGVHVLPGCEISGLRPLKETLEAKGDRDGLEVDLVTYDAKKFCQGLFKKDGNLLEQVYSPLVLCTTPAHDELKVIARDCVTHNHVHHYLGFANSQWQLFQREQPRRVKPLLYVFRVLLTGIHLMRTGEVESNLTRLTERYPLPYVPDLVAAKLAGPERATLAAADVPFYEAEYERLRRDLEEASRHSTLPEGPAAFDALEEWLVRVRVGMDSLGHGCSHMSALMTCSRCSAPIAHGARLR
jgi:predicted nucleotidyltransferase